MKLSFLLVLGICVSALGLLRAEGREYDCYMCVLTVEDAIANSQTSLLKACESLFGAHVCADFDIFEKDFDVPCSGDPRSICSQFKDGVCSDIDSERWRSSEENASTKRSENSDIDVRVSKAYGSRGYDKIRISVISSGPLSGYSDIFSYSQQFQYKWTDKFLSTSVFAVVPGEISTFSIAGIDYNILIPRKNDGVRGVVIADPCFTNEFVWCTYGDKLNMFNRSTEILNAINFHDDSNFWMILGDNFYDQSGEPTSAWFAALSKQTKSKVFGSVPGNHDFWIFSSPVVWTKRDQLGNGFMQFYGQDVAAGVANELNGSFAPLDFSVEPVTRNSMPPASDFFWYYTMGNTGFIGYSGAHSYEEMLPYLKESCLFMEAENPATVLLLGTIRCPVNCALFLSLCDSRTHFYIVEN
jgi:hypothetical protein